MPSKRTTMAALGYSVSERSSHMGHAWDWSRPGKGPMDARHFRSVDEAWLDAENAFDAEVKRAREVVAAVGSGGDRVPVILAGKVVGEMDADVARGLFDQPRPGLSIGATAFDEAWGDKGP